MKWRTKKITGFRIMINAMTLWFLIFQIFAFFILSPSCSILPKKSPGKYLESGKKYFEKKDYTKAYKNYSKAIELNPVFYSAYWERAIVEIKMDSLEKAIDDMG